MTSGAEVCGFVTWILEVNNKARVGVGFLAREVGLTSFTDSEVRETDRVLGVNLKSG